MFQIKFLENVQSRPDKDEHVQPGEIVIDSFSETFLSPLDYWTTTQYQDQWADAIAHLLHTNTPTGLITAMYDPNLANYIEWWLLYPVDTLVYIQNQLLFMDSLPTRFDPDHPYEHISPYERHTKEGEHISQWTIARTAIEEFLTKMKHHSSKSHQHL